MEKKRKKNTQTSRNKLEADKIVILPSYNEIGSLIKICKELKKKKINFIVLDDNSNDGTYQWLKKNSVNFIRNRKNLGYEKNIKKGFKYALKKGKSNT